jgi:hypothetical protein
MASTTTTTYPSTTLGKGQGHPAGGTNASAVAKVLAWVARNPAAARNASSATALCKLAGVHAYAGQYAYRQYLRTSGMRVGRGRAWQPQPQAAARKGAKANAAAAAKAAKQASKGKAPKAPKATAPKAQPQPVQPTPPAPVPTATPSTPTTGAQGS